MTNTTNVRIVADDPDETAGRALYRARGDALATTQASIAMRKVKLKPGAKRDAPRPAGTAGVRLKDAG